MPRLIPDAASFLENRLVQHPTHEWILPAMHGKRRYGVCKILPAGKPDCLRVEIIHFGDGTERCTAAVYGEHVYVIHYEFKAHVHAKD
jgi:hypothetical protein